MIPHTNSNPDKEIQLTETKAAYFVQQSYVRKKLAKFPRLLFLHKIFVFCVGSIVIFAGILMLALPGPGWLTILLGLAIMGTEFTWAQKTQAWLKTKLITALTKFRNRKKGTD
ncbi:TIGR02611 family protein [Canibacter sp. lx-72]|uniref:PGPGW domain-containing protein n=1 Tax=Canibacter zhuwentaonis TaxID=2837491 RepID=UPI001BDD9ECD|nr:PGPGW domain-containing protein [Canibacter zhuwentaonis]MBT1018557.1 TIGR02611 family protein [Canibacter zhuwentaonis]